MTKNEVYDVIVVGAGLAGLTAAKKLIAGGKSVIVLEGKSHAGGRTLSADVSGSDRPVDWGAEWVIPDLHPQMMTLIEEHGFHIEGEDDDAIWDIPGFNKQISYDALRRERPSFDAALTSLQAWADAPAEQDETTLSLTSLLSRLIEDETDRYLLEAALFPLTGADPDEVSAHAIRKEIEFHAQSVHLTISPETCRLDRCCGGIAAAMSQQLPEGTVQLDWSVTDIVTNEDGRLVQVSGPSGTLKAKKVLVAVPVAALHQIRFAPEIPAISSTASAQMNAGRVVKIWGRLRGKVPATRLSVGHLLRLVYAWAHPEGETLVSAQVLAKDLVNQDLHALLQSACPESEILEADKHHWPADPYARGSWIAARIGPYPPDVFAQPFGRIQVIGGDVAASWAGWMEGAVLSATSAAEALLAEEKP